ncbi:MAG: cation:proton antiporter [Candidatus Omnitrophica bacterium]|nr:cation:proton antiporter [Candidatus Omnitrophota bacterium]
MHADPIATVLLGILIILVATRIFGSLAERIGQPAVFGELFVGIVLGNLHLFGIYQLEFLKVDYPGTGVINFADPEHCAGIVIDIMSRIGLILLLFTVGLNTSLSQMKRTGWTALSVAVLGVLMPLTLGWTVGAILLPERHWVVHLFIGAALSATSIGITARVLEDLGRSKSSESQIILGAAILDDVFGLLILAIVQGIILSSGSGPTIHLGQIGIIILKATSFLLGAMLFGQLASRWILRFSEFLHGQRLLLVSGLTFCFMLAWIANLTGLDMIVGAFAAGLILDKCAYARYAEAHDEPRLKELVQPIRDLFAPIFFVMMGLRVDLESMANPSVLMMAGVFLVIAVLGKQACSLGVFSRDTNRWAVGVGMIPRGEVGLIFAAIGRQMEIAGQPVLSSSTFVALVLAILATTMITPPMLKWSFK